MSNVLISEDTMTNIADAIREKTAKQDLMTPAEMPDEILSISGGGTPVSVQKKDVCFYDYDGTLVYSYTLQELQALTELPALPIHEGLVSQGWNWTLSGLKNQNSIMDVGALYITDDGATRIHISISEGRQYPSVCYRQSGMNNSIIDWGDGSPAVSSTGANVCKYHTYEFPGDYVISIMPDEGTQLTFLGDYSYGAFLLMQENQRKEYLSYDSTVTAIEIGRNVQVQISAFCHMRRLRTITIPAEISSIGDYAFYFGGALQCLILPHVTTIPLSFTYDNSCLKTLCLPEGLETISNYSLSKIGVDRICVPETVTTIGRNAFSYNHAMSEVHLPRGLKTIDTNSFYEDYTLGSINRLEQLEIIASGAFAYTHSLGTIHLPDTLVSIGASAFDDSGVKKAYFYATTPPTAGNYTSVPGYEAAGTIYVPHGCGEAYKTANQWSGSANYIQEMDP